MFQNEGPAYERQFSSAFVFLFGCINLNKKDLVLIEFQPTGENSLAIKEGQEFWKKLNTIQRTICWALAAKGNQFISAKNLLLIWILACFCKQNLTDLFWVTWSLFLNSLIGF